MPILPSTGDAASSWVAHLCAGGTVPWSRWRSEHPVERDRSAPQAVPGAQQLELLRRLNEAGDVSAALAERVLGASAPGRGRPDLELEGAVEPRAFGPAPVDPGELPDDELLRVAAGLLAEDVVAAGLPPASDPPRARPWRTRYRLVGDPGLVDPAREELVARGRPPGGRAAAVLVLGTDLPRMMVDTWAARCLDDPAPAWERWCARARRHDRLPPRVDLALAARTAAERVGPGRVHVVLDPAALPRLTGVRRLHPPPAPADELGADGLELARRVSSVLGLLVTPERRGALLRRTLVPRLTGPPDGRTGPPLAVPARHLDWLQRRAARMREELSSGGYAVHGDLDVLLPIPTDGAVGTGTPSPAGTLGLAVRLLLGGPDGARTGPAGGSHPGADSDKERT